MNMRTDYLLRALAALLMLMGAAMLIAGIDSTIPFAAIASGAALFAVVTAASGDGRDHPSH